MPARSEDRGQDRPCCEDKEEGGLRTMWKKDDAPVDPQTLYAEGQSPMGFYRQSFSNSSPANEAGYCSMVFTMSVRVPQQDFVAAGHSSNFGPTTEVKHQKRSPRNYRTRSRICRDINGDSSETILANKKRKGHGRNERGDFMLRINTANLVVAHNNRDRETRRVPGMSNSLDELNESSPSLVVLGRGYISPGSNKMLFTAGRSQDVEVVDALSGTGVTTSDDGYGISSRVGIGELRQLNKSDPLSTEFIEDRPSWTPSALPHDRPGGVSIEAPGNRISEELGDYESKSDHPSAHSIRNSTSLFTPYNRLLIDKPTSEPFNEWERERERGQKGTGEDGAERERGSTKGETELRVLCWARNRPAVKCKGWARELWVQVETPVLVLIEPATLRSFLSFLGI
ncbi:hypothetical protein WN55_09705 [Dufourea novaeangliae]|uniref:Uncharacterized protein n=1 Tax=Dufourea novaeangliae TaxID=178035 RepID=A0A154NZ07_DUFNO|nr:hypothetical protein WN55_09705 [Dufourea novaeangliae]